MTISGTRTERDAFGPIEVPAERLWGAQTQRSLEHFRISREKMPVELIRALLLVKRTAAHVNLKLELLPRRRRTRSSVRPTKRSRVAMPTSSRSPCGKPARGRRPT